MKKKKEKRHVEQERKEESEVFAFIYSLMLLGFLAFSCCIICFTHLICLLACFFCLLAPFFLQYTRPVFLKNTILVFNFRGFWNFASFPRRSGENRDGV